MNGRCETDPLDLAVNVCDRCYGEFCEKHLVRPKGRRHPFCSNCALAASGVRGSTKLEVLGSRRTAKKRRAELKAQSGGGEQVFKFFDDEAEANTIPEPDQTKKNQNPTEDELPPTPAMAKLKELRRGTDSSEPEDGDLLPSAQPEQTAPPAKPAPMAPPVTPELVEQAEMPPPPEQPAPAIKTPAVKTPAVETPTLPSERTGTEPQHRQAPKPAAAANEPASPSAIPESVSFEPAAVVSTEQSAKQQPDDRPPGALPLPSRQSQLPDDDQRRGQAVHTVDHKPADTAPPHPPPPAHRRQTAPMIGEVKNVAGRRADDAAAPQPEAAVSAASTSPPPIDTRNAIEEFDAERPADKPSDNPPGQADTDDNGNWIPPILRGFAPDAAEAKADLPHRRASD